jgi:hypothetical protein
MDNIKKQGEEELKRALLMMKYDNRKTLKENTNIIFEQSTQTTNIVTDKDLMGQTDVLDNLKSFIIHDLGANMSMVPYSRRYGVKGAVDALDDLYVGMDDLNWLLVLVQMMKGKCWVDESDPANQIKKPAMERFLELYSEDENGDDLIEDIEAVGTRTLPTGAEQLKKKIIGNIRAYQIEDCSATEANVDDSGKSSEDNKANQVDEPKVPGEDDEYKNTKFRRFIDKSEVER